MEESVTSDIGTSATKGSWNAQLYDTFNKERIQPSIDLINRIDKA